MPIIFHGRNRLGLYLSPMKMCCSQQHICLRIILLMDGWMDGQHDSIQFRVIIPLIILFFQDALFLFTLLSMRYVRFLKARIISACSINYEIDGNAGRVVYLPRFALSITGSILCRDRNKSTIKNLTTPLTLLLPCDYLAKISNRSKKN